MPPSVRGAEVAAAACGVSGSDRLKVPLAERFAAAPDVAALVPFGVWRASAFATLSSSAAGCGTDLPLRWQLSHVPHDAASV